MNREEILNEIKQYFDIEELVCDHVLERWEDNPERAWDFLDTNFLHCLLLLRRDVVGQPMYCNNHKRGQHQRGLRCNMCDIVKSKSKPYMSAHVLGKGADFSIPAASSVDIIRRKIKTMSDIWPCPVRIEGGVSWLHFDVMPNNAGVNVYEFKAE